MIIKKILHKNQVIAVWKSIERNNYTNFIILYNGLNLHAKLE